MGTLSKEEITRFFCLMGLHGTRKVHMQHVIREKEVGGRWHAIEENPL